MQTHHQSNGSSQYACHNRNFLPFCCSCTGNPNQYSNDTGLRSRQHRAFGPGWISVRLPVLLSRIHIHLIGSAHEQHLSASQLSPHGDEPGLCYSFIINYIYLLFRPFTQTTVRNRSRAEVMVSGHAKEAGDPLKCSWVRGLGGITWPP